MCVDSILSLPPVSLSSLLHLWCVWCDTQSSHVHTTTYPLHPPLTLLSFTFSFRPSSHYCVAVCGWVSSILSSSSTSFLGEGANALGAWGGNSPARRGGRGEKLLISRSSDNFPVCAEQRFTHKHHRTAAAGFHHMRKKKEILRNSFRGIYPSDWKFNRSDAETQESCSNL